MPWIVARTEPRREHIAQSFVKTLHNHQTYLPIFRDWRSKQIQPLFPNYLFIQSLTGLWWHLRSTIGVMTLIMRGEVPDLMPDSAIEVLQENEKNGLVQIQQLSLHRGQRVSIVGSAMNGHVGIFEKMSGRDRCRILFSMLGQEVRADVDVCYVREAA